MKIQNIGCLNSKNYITQNQSKSTLNNDKSQSFGFQVDDKIALKIQLGIQRFFAKLRIGKVSESLEKIVASIPRLEAHKKTRGLRIQFVDFDSPKASFRIGKVPSKGKSPKYKYDFGNYGYLDLQSQKNVSLPQLTRGIPECYYV